MFCLPEQGGVGAALQTGGKIGRLWTSFTGFAAAPAGLGGGLFTFSFLIVAPEAFPIVLSIEFVVMVAVGGLGNIYGAVAPGARAALRQPQQPGGDLLETSGRTSPLSPHMRPRASDRA